MPAFMLWNNVFDAATVTTTTSGTMLRPLSELKVPFAKGLCRGPANGGSSTPATLNIRADLGAATELVQGIALIGFNAVTYATADVALSTVSFGGTDAGASGGFWFRDYGNEVGQMIFLPFPEAVSVRYVEINLYVFGRPSGQRYADLRRVMVLNGGAFANGFDRDWSIQTSDPSNDLQTDAGGVFITEHTGFREIQFAMTGRSIEEMKRNYIATNGTDSLQRVFDMAGRRKEMIISPRIFVSDVDAFQNSLYCRLSEWSQIQHVGGNYFSCDSIRAKEIPHPPLS